MRRMLAVVLIALTGLIGLIGLSGTAHAGGPTSVLITDPVTGRATALYYTSPDYAALERLLNDPTTTQGLPASSQLSEQYNLTWMIHDVQPWRMDTLHLTDAGTAYVVTAANDISVESDLVMSKGRRVAQSKELVALLDRVFAAAPAEAPAVQPVVEQQPAAAPLAEDTTRWFSLAGWRWAVPGVLGGLLVGLVAHRRRSPQVSRRVLVDAEPSATRSW